jgi:hypothetical protein
MKGDRVAGGGPGTRAGRGAPLVVLSIALGAAWLVIAAAMGALYSKLIG